MSSAEENGGAGGMEAMLGSVLETLGKNPELLELAGRLAGMAGGTPEPSDAEENTSADGLNALMGSLFGENGGAEERQGGNNAENFPPKAGKPEKSEKTEDSAARAAALLKALRPFMNDRRGESVDRLLQILPTAKTIRTALHLFGSL